MDFFAPPGYQPDYKPVSMICEINRIKLFVKHSADVRVHCVPKPFLSSENKMMLQTKETYELKPALQSELHACAPDKYTQV